MIQDLHRRGIGTGRNQCKCEALRGFVVIKRDNMLILARWGVRTILLLDLLHMYPYNIVRSYRGAGLSWKIVGESHDAYRDVE